MSRLSRIEKPKLERASITKEEIQINTLITRKEAVDLQPGDIIVL